MSIEQARAALRSVPIGLTRVVAGHVITAWASNVVEIDTWGRATDDVESAARWLADNTKDQS